MVGGLGQARALQVFVSYCTSDGEQYAREVKAIFQTAGHDAWVWVVDHTVGSYTWSEIAAQIDSREILLCVLTPGSATSEPQRCEVNLALNAGRQVWTIARRDAEVYMELRASNYERFTDHDYADLCQRLATQRVPGGPTTREPTPFLEARRLDIEGLRRRTERLEARVLTEGLAAARLAYLAATIPRQVVQFSPHATSDGTFQVLFTDENRSLATFNDPSFHWTRYFEQCARLVAAAEHRYFLDTLLAARATDGTLELGESRYALLDEMMDDMDGSGYEPKHLFVPPEAYVGFFEYFRDRVAWPVDLHIRLSTCSGGAVRIISSSGRHFVITSPKVAVWRVVPDAGTGEALTVAVGANPLYPDLVRLIFQAVAKLDVVQPPAMRVIRAVEG